jgi:hypothetical protein
MGVGDVPGPELFWMSHWDEWYPLVFQVALVRGHGRVLLVNTGPAEDLTAMNDGWLAFLGERARFRREPGEFIIDQLARHGILAEDVTDIVLTPLQLYTVSNVLLFPRARIHISRRGWRHFHETREHPHDSRETSIPFSILSELVGPLWSRVVLLDDEHEIAPGLRTWWAGGHHRASVAVEIDTLTGTAVASDAFFYLENVTSMHPIGICENIYEALAAMRRAIHAKHIIPLYDPHNFERYLNGLVQ